MQLQIRGQQTTVIECEDTEKVQHIKVLFFFNYILFICQIYYPNLSLSDDIQALK